MWNNMKNPNISPENTTHPIEEFYDENLPLPLQGGGS